MVDVSALFGFPSHWARPWRQTRLKLLPCPTGLFTAASLQACKLNQKPEEKHREEHGQEDRHQKQHKKADSGGQEGLGVACKRPSVGWS